MSHQSSPVSRRNVARGALWATPAIAVAAAAPATAVSPVPTYAISGITKYNQSWTTTATDGTYAIKVFSSASGSTTPGQGFCVSNTTTTTTITNATVTYWFASPNLTFTRNASHDSGCWGTLARDTTKAAKTYNGCTYYAYTATLTCAVKAVSGSTCLPTFAFQSQSNLTTSTQLCDVCSSSTCTTRMNYYVSSSATVNGAVQTLSYGPLSVS